MRMLLVFFNRKKGIVEAVEYNDNGRMQSLKRFENVRALEFHGVSVRSAQGMEHSITLYVVEGEAEAEARGSKVIVKGLGGRRPDD
jgi:hypothetical protein